MNKVTVYKVSLIFTAIICLIGPFFKIQHYRHGSFFLVMSLIFSLFVMILGLTDVYKDDLFKPNEKFMWTIGFIFLPWIAGILYFPKYKKRNLT